MQPHAIQRDQHIMELYSLEWLMFQIVAVCGVHSQLPTHDENFARTWNSEEVAPFDSIAYKLASRHTPKCRSIRSADEIIWQLLRPNSFALSKLFAGQQQNAIKATEEIQKQQSCLNFDFKWVISEDWDD